MHSGAFAQVGKLYPVDESGKDPSFALFRARLMDALKRRDRKFLMSMVHPKIMNSFGGNDGTANFVEQWRLGKPNSQVWDVLLTALELGGTFERRNKHKTFWAPYVFTRFPDEVDPYEYQAIVAKNVTVRTKPSASAPSNATLSYDIVETDTNAPAGWVKVKLKSGEGFVPASKIRSAADYRAGFERIRGKWLLTFLVAGD